MATASLTNAVQNAVNLYVTPNHAIQLPAPSPQLVTQVELATVLSLRRESKRVQEQLDSVELSIRTRLEAGGRTLAVLAKSREARKISGDE